VEPLLSIEERYAAEVAQDRPAAEADGLRYGAIARQAQGRAQD